MQSTGSIQGAMPTAQDQALYQPGRHGRGFSYAIPLKPGLYSVRLKFAEPEREWSFMRPMNVDLNGHRVLTDYDICAAAKGWRKAHERTFRHLVPNKNSQEGKHDEGENGDTDMQCMFIQSSNPVRHASPALYDQALYLTARAGRKISMNIKAAPGHYTVHLKFAELWIKEMGQRPMDIEINGKLLWENWDPATAVGMIGMTVDLRAEVITPDSKGKINVTITAKRTNDAILQGVEIK